MKKMRSLFVSLLLICLALPLFGDDAKLQLNDVIARHLESIGTASARAAVKSRSIRGRIHYQVVEGTPGASDGQGMMVSDARRFSVMLKPTDGQYPAEQFVFDGSKSQIGLIGPSRRSSLGQFFYTHDAILRDGLLGGTLTTTWALLDVNSRKATVKYEGIKKIDGRDLHEISYAPRKADADLLIHLYFEPETFRHVKTTYEFTLNPSFSHNQLQHGSYTRYKVEENFSDFRATDGLTLPSKWTLRCTSQGDRTFSIEWQFMVDAIAHNNVVD